MVRFFGPLAPKRTMQYAQRRFREGVGLSPGEQAAFGAYVYHILASNGSGEFALPHLLAPGAWAREPLTARFDDLRMPVTFLYGATDWMDWRAGQEACEVVRAKGAVSADLHRIPDAGHYAFIDQPELFHEHVLRIMGVEPREGGPRAGARVEDVVKQAPGVEDAVRVRSPPWCHGP